MKTNVEVLDPEEIFQLLNRELPAGVRDHVLVAGSLAAAFQVCHF